MSRCRSMYAGSSGSVYNANTMHEGNGNGKWQGLVSTTNMRSRLIPYVRTRADSDNRNVVFYMNQLGGVGRISKMFATTADGVQDGRCILPSDIKNALQQLTNYASKRGLLLGLAGIKESPTSDLHHELSGFKKFDPEMKQYVELINGLGLEFAVTGPNDVQRHEVVMVTEPDAKLLKGSGFGFPVPALCDSIIAYGFNCKPMNAIAKIDSEGLKLTLTFTLDNAAYNRVNSGVPGNLSSVFISYVNSSDSSDFFDFTGDGQIMVKYSVSTWPYPSFGPAPVVQVNDDPLKDKGSANEFQVYAKENETGFGGNTGGYGAGVDVEVTIPLSKMPQYKKTNMKKGDLQLKLPNTDGYFYQLHDGGFYNTTQAAGVVSCAFDTSALPPPQPSPSPSPPPVNYGIDGLGGMGGDGEPVPAGL